MPTKPAPSTSAPTPTKPSRYVVAIGLNLADDSRYEPGMPIASSLIEPWMIDDGVVTLQGRGA